MFEGPLQDLIDEFSRLPGVGPKSAQRIAFHVLHMDPEDVDRLQNALGAVRDGVTFCRICCNISREEVCRICVNSQRDASTICVVEEPKDIQVIERTGEYNGRYHVLGGALDPLANVGPKDLNISALLLTSQCYRKHDEDNDDIGDSHGPEHAANAPCPRSAGVGARQR